MDTTKRNTLIISFSFLLFLFFLSRCSACNSKRGRNNSNNPAQRRIKPLPPGNNEKNITLPDSAGKISQFTTVKYTIKNGVMEVPVSINKNPMSFIFDTGAGLISISNVEATYLYKQGSLSDEDILGKAQFTDANGNINEGTIINLKEVNIGDRTIYNIKASVVNNLAAPLLFGQSAMQKFGKISIDYKKEQIQLEY